MSLLYQGVIVPHYIHNMTNSFHTVSDNGNNGLLKQKHLPRLDSDFTCTSLLKHSQRTDEIQTLHALSHFWQKNLKSYCLSQAAKGITRKTFNYLL